MQQQLLEPTHEPDNVVRAVQETDPDLLRVMRTEQLPVGRRGQLWALRRQLLWCDQAVKAARREAVRAMRDENLTEGDRWAAVRRQRTLAHKVSREILPLLTKVPPQLHAEPEYIECQRAAHALRRTVEAALRDNANFTVDLIAASGAAPSWRRD